MELDLSGILAPPVTSANDDADQERLVAILTGMQETINGLLEIATQHQARLAVLEIENRRLKARTDAPARSSILRVN